MEEKIIYTPGICVHCGSDRILYSDPVITDYLTYHYECEECHKKGKEVYDLDFIHNKGE